MCSQVFPGYPEREQQNIALCSRFACVCQKLFAAGVDAAAAWWPARLLDEYCRICPMRVSCCGLLFVAGDVAACIAC